MSPVARDEAIEHRVALLAVGRCMKDDAGERFQRQLQRSEQIGVGGEPILVGGGDFGRQQAAVGQHEPPCPALLRALSPAHQIGRRHGRRWLSAANVSCQLASAADEFGVERLAFDGNGQGRFGAGGGKQMQNAKCKMQNANCKLKSEN